MKDISMIMKKQQDFWNTGVTKQLTFRKQQLRILRKMIQENESSILYALKKDLNKSTFEAYETEIGIILDEIGHMLKRINRLSKPMRAKTPLMHFISSSRIYNEPYGVVLIMSTWNYPFQLAIAPLIGAIAAGNCAIIKPSEYAPYTSKLINDLILENFKEDYIAVIEGGLSVNQALLSHKFDYIFFTGSVAVGRIVMMEAAKNLTPVTLELGGKSPCIVDETADLEKAAKRIIWGKLINAGQTCVAPDYVLVHKDLKEKLIQRMGYYIKQFYGETPCNNEEYPKIINQKHFERLLGFMKDGRVVIGGGSNSSSNQIEPTIIDKVSWNAPIMQEEIFGPILPVIEFDTLMDVVSSVNKRPKPLALYYFTSSKENEQFMMNAISFGGGCINDTIVHLANSNLAFGGIGESGMGSYHGDESYKTFSHRKGVLKKSNLIDVPLRYPPHKKHIKYLKQIQK